MTWQKKIKTEDAWATTQALLVQGITAGLTAKNVPVHLVAFDKAQGVFKATLQFWQGANLYTVNTSGSVAYVTTHTASEVVAEVVKALHMGWKATQPPPFVVTKEFKEATLDILLYDLSKHHGEVKVTTMDGYDGTPDFRFDLPGGAYIVLETTLEFLSQHTPMQTANNLYLRFLKEVQGLKAKGGLVTPLPPVKDDLCHKVQSHLINNGVPVQEVTFGKDDELLSYYAQMDFYYQGEPATLTHEYSDASIQDLDESALLNRLFFDLLDDYKAFLQAHSPLKLASSTLLQGQPSEFMLPHLFAYDAAQPGADQTMQQTLKIAEALALPFGKSGFQNGPPPQDPSLTNLANVSNPSYNEIVVSPTSQSTEGTMALKIKHKGMDNYAILHSCFGVSQMMVDFLKSSGITIEFGGSEIQFRLGNEVLADLDMMAGTLSAAKAGTLKPAEKKVIAEIVVKAAKKALKAAEGKVKILTEPADEIDQIAAVLTAATAPVEGLVPVKTAPVDFSILTQDPVLLKDAKHLYQPVRASSPTSVYHVVALNGDLRVAARYQNGNLSLRAEGNIMKYQQQLINAGFDPDHFPQYCSVHLAVSDNPVLAARTLGSFLGGLTAQGIPFDTPVPMLPVFANYGK